MMTLVGFLVFVVVWAIVVAFSSPSLIPSLYLCGVGAIACAMIAYWFLR